MNRLIYSAYRLREVEGGGTYRRPQRLHAVCPQHNRPLPLRRRGTLALRHIERARSALLANNHSISTSPCSSSALDRCRPVETIFEWHSLTHSLVGSGWKIRFKADRNKIANCNVSRVIRVLMLCDVDRIRHNARRC